MHNPPLLFLADWHGRGSRHRRRPQCVVGRCSARDDHSHRLARVEIKELSLLFLSQDEAENFFLHGLLYERCFYGYAAVTFLIGLFLVYGSAAARPLR